MKIIHSEPAHKLGERSGRVEALLIWRDGDSVFRTRYHRDSYPDQSYLETEVWTSVGWKQVIRQTGHELEFESSHAKVIDEKLLNGFIARQQDIAMLVTQP